MNRIMRELLNTAIYLLCVLGAVWLVITFVGQRTEVEGASMENTLHNGDNLIVDKLSYRFHDPERFDIIVFPFQFQDNTYYIKRIIGLPGETVQIMDDGSIYINGEKLEENYGMEVIKPETNRPGRRNPLNWGMMNILTWETTATIPATVVRIWWVT